MPIPNNSLDNTMLKNDSFGNETFYFNTNNTVFIEYAKELLVNGASAIEIRNEALKGTYKPLVVDGINKVLDGITNLNEIDRKLIIY